MWTSDRYTDCPFRTLFGHRISAIRLANGEASLAFELDRSHTEIAADAMVADGYEVAAAEHMLRCMAEGRTVAVFEGEADCCSETWFADIVAPDALLGRVVTGARSIDLPEHLTQDFGKDGKPRTRQEVDQVYGWEIRTSGGVCTIAVRNSSNGYYGGWVRGGKLVHPSTVSTWRVIEEDWSA